MERSKCRIELDTKRVGSHLQTSMNTQWILYVDRGKTQALAHAHMTYSEALSGVEPGNLCFLNSVCSHVRCSLCSRMHRAPPRSCRIGWQTYQERNRLVELKKLKWDSYTPKVMLSSLWWFVCIPCWQEHGKSTFYSLYAYYICQSVVTVLSRIPHLCDTHTHLYIESSNSQKHFRVLSRCQRIILSSPVFIRVQEIEFGLSDFHSKCLYPMSHLPDSTLDWTEQMYNDYNIPLL